MGGQASPDTVYGSSMGPHSAHAEPPEDVPQPRVGEICRKVSFWRTIVLRPLAALRASEPSKMKACVQWPLSRATAHTKRHLQVQKRRRMGGDAKTASLTLAVERDATMAVGRPYGDAIDGAVLVGRQRITCDLASLPPRPYHVCTPPPRVRTSKTAADLTQLTVSSRACGRRLVPAAHE